MIMSFLKKILRLKSVLIGCYMNTHLIDSEDLDINAVMGTIGGNVINANGIVGDKFSIIDGTLTAEDAVFINASIEGLSAIDATITGTLQTAETGQRAVLDGLDNSFKFFDATDLKVHVSSGITDPLGNVDAGMVVYGASGAQNMLMGGGILAHDGTNTIAITGSSILLATPSTFHSGQTITKVAGGVTFQFVNGVLVL